MPGQPLHRSCRLGLAGRLHGQGTSPQGGPNPLPENWQHGDDDSGNVLTHSLDDLLELGASGHAGTDLRCFEVAGGRQAKVDPLICQA